MKLSTLERKKYRIRNKIKKSSKGSRYRLSVSRSSKNLSAQIIDDVNNITIVSATSLKKELKIQKKVKQNYQLSLPNYWQLKQKKKK